MIFEVIKSQVETLRQPLAAVVLSTLRSNDSPALLLLHWHGFAPDDARASKGGCTRSPLPSSALQLSPRWLRLEELDREMLDAAWQMGAWSLTREERRACDTVGAPPHEAMACRQAFGDNPLDPADASHLVAEAPDRSDLLSSAAQRGYVSWTFRPVANGLWRDAGIDASLEGDGRRTPPCPFAPQAAVGTQVVRKTYQLGRIDRIVMP